MIRRYTVPALKRPLGHWLKGTSTTSIRTITSSRILASAIAARGQVVDIHNRRIFPGEIHVEGKTITKIRELKDDGDFDSSASSSTNDDTNQKYIIPGFVDSHVHVESSLLVPSEFARLAVRHGTVATVSDPHEIANVCGMDGIRFMLGNAAMVPFHFFFGAPSCVPATQFETAGATISADDIRELFDHPLYQRQIVYLAEMMNWPGVIAKDPQCLEKIQIALDRNLPVDGHAPNVRSPLIEQYAKHGMTTDHESFTLPEAQEKIAAGLKVQIREGSGARNFSELHPVLGQYPELTMFCCDDTHPDLLMEQHLDWHVREAVKLGYNLFDVLAAASKNTVEHYNLPVGLLREGDNADFIVVDNLQDFGVQETWINGECVARDKQALFESVAVPKPINFFDRHDPISVEQIARDPHEGPVRVIVAHDGQLVTTEQWLQPHEDPDVLKIINVNRYDRHAPIATAYIRGFGLQQGAFAGSVAHDSHNIVAVGCTDQDLVDAVNAIIEVKGGLSFSKNGETELLPLPVAGLMSTDNGPDVAKEYILLDRLVKENGSKLRAPYMTLSFMALLVIPQLKLSDKGLFCGTTFQFVNVSFQEDEEEQERQATPRSEAVSSY